MPRGPCMAQVCAHHGEGSGATTFLYHGIMQIQVVLPWLDHLGCTQSCTKTCQGKQHLRTACFRLSFKSWLSWGLWTTLLILQSVVPTNWQMQCVCVTAGQRTQIVCHRTPALVLCQYQRCWHLGMLLQQRNLGNISGKSVLVINFPTPVSVHNVPQETSSLLTRGNF